MVLRRRRLLRGAERASQRQPGRLPAVQRRDGAIQRGTAFARRRLLALQAARRDAPLLLRAAADRLGRGRRVGAGVAGDGVARWGAPAGCLPSATTRSVRYFILADFGIEWPGPQDASLAGRSPAPSQTRRPP